VLPAVSPRSISRAWVLPPPVISITQAFDHPHQALQCRSNPVFSDRKTITLLVGFFDLFGLWSGRIIAWLIIPMVMSLVYEVVARYFFNAPTIWAYDMTFMTYGSFFMIGSAYTLLRAGHIRTDTFYGEWSPQKQGAVDAVCYVFFFFPPLILFLWVTWDYFIVSYGRGERSVTSPWMPIIYPLKFALPLSTFLLIMQGISEFLRSMHAYKTGVWIARPHAIAALSNQGSAAQEDKPSV
jgi:TRAP-type mannitol/chloroaromatic compound transport system permease small subunit